MADRWNQYTQDVPTITQGDYSYRNPTHPSAQPSPGRRTAFAGGGAPVSSSGVAMTTAHQQQRAAGEDFEAAWHRSQQRADRLRAQYEGQHAWTGSPDDYNAVVAPDRSRVQMAELMNAQRQGGIHPRNRDDFGGASVPARPTNGNGNGNGLSGGAAKKVPTGVGGDW